MMYQKLKSIQKNKKHSADLEFVDWDGNFSNVKILHEGVCGGKVCCIFVDYEGKRYVLKEMKKSFKHIIHKYNEQKITFDEFSSQINLTYITERVKHQIST